MAKVFAGFTPDQMGKIVPEMQGMQADEQKKFLAANPAAAARVGKMYETAQKRVQMAQGGYMKKGYLVGGMASSVVSGLANSPTINTLVQKAAPIKSDEELKADYEKAKEAAALQRKNGFLGQVVLPGEGSFEDFKNMQSNLVSSAPNLGMSGALGNVVGFGEASINPVEETPIDTKMSKLPEENITNRDVNTGNQTTASTTETTNPSTANTTTTTTGGADAAGKAVADLTKTLISSPEKMTTKAGVDTISAADEAAGKIAEGTGTAGTLYAAGETKAQAQKDVADVTPATAAKFDPLEASAGVEDIMKRLEAATGKPREEALVDAQSMDPQTLSQLGLSVAQIQQAQQVQQVPDRKVEAGEMISGSAVDMGRVKAETNFAAATGSPSTDATVQGQLTGLMEDFEGKAPPAWAAGAMRAAAAQMAARGLSGSSMAGQAIIQAAMESALPIAQADAATFQRFELQNLSNKQQAAVFAAEQRAKFLGLEFTQDFQARVSNAAKISDIANMNFTADQQVALENARMAQSVDLANLSAQNAKIMADAAAMSQMDMANLNNRQQAAVQNAKSFLQMDMQNLSNEQQTAMFKSQQLTNTLLSDTAAENAAAQFNASSENQTNQFFADLNTRIQTFNTDQQNQMQRFNAGETNALAQFNATQANMREQFNATNALVIAQANAAWAQKITTTENAAQNEANRQFAQAANQMTALGYNAIIQQYRDRISYAWQTANNDADRATSIATSKIGADATKYAADAAAAAKSSEAAASKSSSFWESVGNIAAAVLS